MRRPRLPLVLAGALGLGCGGEPSPEDLGCAGELVGYTAVVLPEVVRPYCLECHSGDRVGAARSNAPPGVDFDTWERAAPHAAALADAVTSGRMPPAGRPRPDEVARERVERWRRCGLSE